jgi:flavodoxin
MPKPALVVYYSRTGHTGMVARAVAEKMGADLEEIREPRQGRRGWWRSLVEVWRGHTPPIVPLTHRPEDYELVVVGSPVWASHMASPILSWLRQQGGRLRKVAFFVTEGGRGGAKAIESMGSLCRAEPAARLEVTQSDLKSGSFRNKVDDFAARLGT